MAYCCEGSLCRRPFQKYVVSLSSSNGSLVPACAEITKRRHRPSAQPSSIVQLGRHAGEVDDDQRCTMQGREDLDVH